MSENTRHNIVVALIAGSFSVIGAFVGILGGREVVAVEMRALRESVALNAQQINQNAEQLHRLAADVSTLRSVVTAVQAVQSERGPRIQRLEDIPRR